MDTILLIDGENFKGKIKTVFKENNKDTPVWHEYNFKGLLDKIFEGITIGKVIFYFAKIKEHPDQKEKSKELIENQRLLKTHLEKLGYEVILSGNVTGQYSTNKNGQQVLVFKEKGVDVKIAVDMVTIACDKKAKEIILGSSDSDLQPAVKEIKERGLKSAYLGFEVNPNKGLSAATTRTFLIRTSEVLFFEKIQPKLPNL